MIFLNPTNCTVSYAKHLGITKMIAPFPVALDNNHEDPSAYASSTPLQYSFKLAYLQLHVGRPQEIVKQCNSRTGRRNMAYRKTDKKKLQSLTAIKIKKRELVQFLSEIEAVCNKHLSHIEIAQHCTKLTSKDIRPVSSVPYLDASDERR